MTDYQLEFLLHSLHFIAVRIHLFGIPPCCTALDRQGGGGGGGGGGAGAGGGDDARKITVCVTVTN